MGNINSIQTKNYIKFEKYYYAGDLNVDNLPHGRGLMLYENGNSFFGHFINGKKHGKGIYIDKNLTKYISKWKYDHISNKVKVKQFDSDIVYLFYYKNGLIDHCKVYEYISNKKKKKKKKNDGILEDSEIQNRSINFEKDNIMIIQNCQEKSIVNKKEEIIDIPNNKYNENDDTDKVDNFSKKINLEQSQNNMLKYKKKKTFDEMNSLNDSIFCSSCESTSKSIGSDYISHFEKKEKQINKQEDELKKSKENYMNHSEYSNSSTNFENNKIKDISDESIMLRLKNIINNNTDLKIENYELWNKEQVAQWLSLCNVPMKWALSVYKNNINGQRLNNLNLYFIRNKLGILSYGQAIKFLQLIKNLRVTAYNTRFSNTLNLEEYEIYLKKKMKKKKMRENKDGEYTATTSSQAEDFQKNNQKIIMNQIKSMIDQKNDDDKSFSDKIKNGFFKGNTNIRNLQNLVINSIWNKSKDEFKIPIDENNVPMNIEKGKELNTNDQITGKKKKKLKNKYINHIQKNISMLKKLNNASNESQSSNESVTQILSTSSESSFANIHSGLSSKMLFHDKLEPEPIKPNKEKEENNPNLSPIINSKNETNLLNDSNPTKLQDELPKSPCSIDSESSSEKSSETSSETSSFCSEHSEFANFHNNNKIVKYSNNIYINSSLAFSYIYSFIIPPENLTFLYQIRNYYVRDVENDLNPNNELDFCDSFNFYKNCEIIKNRIINPGIRNCSYASNHSKFQQNKNRKYFNYSDCKNERKKTKPQKMKSRVFRGRYMGKDVAIKVLVGNIKNFTKFHKVLYKLYILRHTNIALIMGVSISYPFVFIIYEYIKNLCLFSYLHCVKYKHIYVSKLLKYYQKKFINQNFQQQNNTMSSDRKYISNDDNEKINFDSRNILRNKLLEIKCKNNAKNKITEKNNLKDEQIYSSSTSIKSLDTSSSNMNNTKLKNINFNKNRYINKIHSMFRNKNNILCGNYYYLFRKKKNNISISHEHKNSDRTIFTNESQNLLKNKISQKKINKKLNFKAKIKINRPYAFPPLQEDFNFYLEKKKKKKKILFSYLKTHSYFKSKKCDSRKNKLSDHQIMKIIMDITLACSYLEKQKVRWINLKPTNILLDGSLNAKISDFGIKEIEQCLDINIDYSYIVFPNNVIKFNNKHFKNKIKKIKIVNKGSEDMLHVFSSKNHIYKYNTREINVSSNTHNSSVFFWTSPEILKGKQSPSLYSDVYAYGIILWELMTNSVPFNYRFKSHLLASVGYAKESLPFQNIPPFIKNLIKSCINRNKYKRPTFDRILIEISMIYEQINPKEEDALMSFMDG